MAALLPVWGGLDLTDTSNVGLLLAGVAAVASGVLDHRFLVRTLAPAHNLNLRAGDVGHDPVLLLDRLIHEPARLAILTVLSSVEDADFTFLQRTTGLTKGNLSSHLTKLEAAGLVPAAQRRLVIRKIG